MGSHPADLVLLSPLVLCGRSGQDSSAVGKSHNYDSFMQSTILCTARPQFSALHQHQRAQEDRAVCKLAKRLSFKHMFQIFAESALKINKDDALELLQLVHKCFHPCDRRCSNPRSCQRMYGLD